MDFELRDMFFQVVAFAKAYFFSEDDGRNDDIFVLAARRHPEPTMRFLKTFLPLNTIVSSIECLVSSVFLYFAWEQYPASCTLRWWLLGYAMLQGYQLPVRTLLLINCFFAGAFGLDQEACVTSILVSAAWRAKNVAGQFLSIWFAFGVAWLISEHRSDCPYLTRLVMAMLLSCAARTVVMVTGFQVLVQGDLRAGMPSKSNHPASMALISKLPTLKFSSSSDESGRVSATLCAICLDDFREGEELKRLPCSPIEHLFHCGCIDQWLACSKKCPLCAHPVDA